MIKSIPHYGILCGIIVRRVFYNAENYSVLYNTVGKIIPLCTPHNGENYAGIHNMQVTLKINYSALFPKIVHNVPRLKQNEPNNISWS